jgi:hypothetical protein
MFDRRLFFILLGVLVILSFWTSYELLPKFEQKNKQQKTIATLKTLDQLSYFVAGKEIRVVRDDVFYWIDLGDEYFLANDSFKMFRDFALNIKSERQISRDPTQDEEFGFNDAAGRLVLSDGAEFRVGKRSYGTSMRYLIDTKDESTIHLVDAEPLDALENAKRRFFERRFLNIDLEQVEQMVFQLGEKMKILRSAKDSVDGSQSRWLDQDDQEVSASMENLLERFFKTNVEVYFKDVPHVPETPVLNIQLKIRDGRDLGLDFYLQPTGEFILRLSSAKGKEYWLRLDGPRWATLFSDLKEIL